MLVLRYDGDITRSPEFKLRGKATIEVVELRGYVAADDRDSWISEEEMITSMLEDEDVNGDASLARNKIMYDESLILQDRLETVVELHAGSSFQYGYRQPDDEGYSFFGIEVRWDSGHWEVSETSGGRDCDGEHTNSVEYLIGPGGQMIEERRETYDEYGQAAGF